MKRFSRPWGVVSLLVFAVGCGGGIKKTSKVPTKVVTKPVKKPVKKPPPPPPVCVAQGEQAVIGMSTADGDLVSFCVSSGSDESPCYSLELDSKKLTKLDAPPIPQFPTRTAPLSRLQSTTTEVKSCIAGADEKCTSLKPRVKPGDNPIDAAVNRQGTTVAMLFGDAESGKGVAEVWSVAKKKKLGAIKYAKGDYRCGVAHVLDELVFISASVCAGPAARGGLYSVKGKKVADVGGKDFGTYNTVPVEIGDHRWAFLAENGDRIAIHDSITGKLEQTIELAALWAVEEVPGGDDQAAVPTSSNGNPGESALLRGGDDKLLVITGSPRAGHVGIVDVAAGTVEAVSTLACDAPPPPIGEEPVRGEDGEDGAGEDGAGDAAPEPVSDLD